MTLKSEAYLTGVTRVHTDPTVRATIALPHDGYTWYWKLLAQYSTSILIGADDQANDGFIVVCQRNKPYTQITLASQWLQIETNRLASSYGSSWTTNGMIVVALDRPDNEITFCKI